MSLPSSVAILSEPQYHRVLNDFSVSRVIDLTAELPTYFYPLVILQDLSVLLSQQAQALFGHRPFVPAKCAYIYAFSSLTGIYSARFFPKTADTLLTISLIPTTPLFSAFDSLMSSSSSWNTSITPWYVSAADISKKLQSADKANSRPSSLDTVRWCWRSRLFPTIIIGALADIFLDCLMSCTCCRTTSKLERSQML